MVTDRDVRVVVFDLGGVVCREDTTRQLEALAEAASTNPADVRRHLWDTGFVAACEEGRHSALELFEFTRRMLGLACDYDEFRRRWCAGLTTDLDVLGVIDRYRTMVATALLSDNTPVVLDALPLLFPAVGPRFDYSFFSFQFGKRKADPGLYAAVTAELALRPSQVAFVEAELPHVKAALAYGWQSVLYNAPASLNAWLRQVTGVAGPQGV